MVSNSRTYGQLSEPLLRTACFPAAGIGAVLGLARPANAHAPMTVNKMRTHRNRAIADE